MEDIQVQLQESESKGKYFIEIDGKQASEMTFSKAGTDRIIIDHTEVDPEFRGMGLGEKMVHQAVADARSKGFKILPLCPFAHSVFEKQEEIRDVL